MIDTAVVLLVAIALFGIPAWIPIITRRETVPAFRFALWVTAASQIVQAAFVLLVGTHVLPLSDSLRTAAVGVPLCIAGGVLGMVSRLKSKLGAGCALSGTFGFLCWCFLIMLH